MTLETVALRLGVEPFRLEPLQGATEGVTDHFILGSIKPKQGADELTAAEHH